MHRLSKEGRYTCSELRSAILDDGTKVVTAPVNDIKRPRCGSVDARHILMVRLRDDNETLSAVFYVRQFTSSSDIRVWPMVLRVWSDRCLHGVDRKILDPCL